jgi:hypothetical protein
MRIILDECVPAELGSLMAPHDVTTVQGQGWTGIKNGELLKQIASRFEVFVTVDRNLRYQQNLRAIPFALVVVLAKTNRLVDLAPCVPLLMSALQDIQLGEYREIDGRALQRPESDAEQKPLQEPKS